MQMEIIIKARAPFDFAATAQFMRYTEAEALDVFTANRYRRLFHFGERLCFLNVSASGSQARPTLRVTLDDEGAIVKDRTTRAAAAETIATLVRHIFSTDHDLKKFRARMVGDELMRTLEKAHHGLHIPRWPSLFEALTVSILSQQISTSVAMTLKRRMVERYGARARLDDETLHAFPLPQKIVRASVDELRAHGLSNAKAQSIRELARSFEEGALDESELSRADNESVIERLTLLRGIGRWTAEWALMLYFGRTDVFPANDLALRNFVIKYYNEGRPLKEKEIRRLAAERWGEWASYVAVYCLAASRRGIINLRPERMLLSSEARQ